MEKVWQGDTHMLVFTVRDDKTKLPVDLTGATWAVWAKARKGTPIQLTATVFGAPVNGQLQHQLTGTLEPGTYAVIVKLDKDGQQTTSPTDGSECFEVQPTIGTN